MLGLTFWKHVIEEATDETQANRMSIRRWRLQKSKLLVLVGAAVTAVAFAVGIPVVGLSVYLLTTLPFILFAS